MTESLPGPGGSVSENRKISARPYYASWALLVGVSIAAGIYMSVAWMRPLPKSVRAFSIAIATFPLLCAFIVALPRILSERPHVALRNATETLLLLFLLIAGGGTLATLSRMRMISLQTPDWIGLASIVIACTSGLFYFLAVVLQWINRRA